MDRVVLPGGVLAITLLWLGMLLIPFGLLLLGKRPAALRRFLVVVLGYLVLSSAAGGLAYGMLPADYTKFYRWTLHPTANTLAEIRAVDLQLIEQGVAFSPRYAPARRAEIRAERLRFARDWCVIMGWGLSLVALGFAAWHIAARRGRWRGLSAG